jgi:hypothetical protein
MWINSGLITGSMGLKQFEDRKLRERMPLLEQNTERCDGDISVIHIEQTPLDLGFDQKIGTNSGGKTDFWS